MSANGKLAATFGPGRTTPTPTLETRIAEVLGAHQWYDATTDNEDPATGCTSCDDWYGDENAVDDGTFAKHQAEMLASVIADVWDEGCHAALVSEGYAVVAHAAVSQTNPYRSNDE